MKGVLAYDYTAYKLYKDFARFTFPHVQHHGSTAGGEFNDNKQLHSYIEPSSKQINKLSKSPSAKRSSSNLMSPDLRIHNYVHDTCTFLLAEDEYTGEGVGVGQDLTEREKFFRTLEGLVIRPTARLRFPHLTRRRIGLTVVGDGKTSLFKRSAGRGRTNTYQISCSKADARWDGSKADRPTDASTWAPELRREIRAGGRHEGGLKAEDAR
ncbi:hypothetical protein TIFTF001_042269 [Ficus carica]|uniref:Uncharacterized protein n=1 Tax=Ficus carica TaxID=3494 RepID=A0AA88CXK4_FICCA|nr:hypothetical protein TIFTF001_042266 [Ficus carica]GMN35692.1 hypothetical protein TIFTF001_042269 [Ficus carica]